MDNDGFHWYYSVGAERVFSPAEDITLVTAQQSRALPTLFLPLTPEHTDRLLLFNRYLASVVAGGKL